MKILTPGHKYVLTNYKEGGEQTLDFIHKEQATDGSAALIMVDEGTTNEEVLKVLIDRLQFLQRAFPCRENALVITKLEESLMWLEKRTADRIVRGVEGTNQI